MKWSYIKEQQVFPKSYFFFFSQELEHKIQQICKEHDSDYFRLGFCKLRFYDQVQPATYAYK